MSTIAHPGKPRLRLTERGRAVFASLGIAAVVGTGLLLGWGAAGASAGQDAADMRFEYVSVEAGQSLWQLAEQIAPGVDPREVIADLLVLNNLRSAQLRPGQELAIPPQYAH